MIVLFLIKLLHKIDCCYVYDKLVMWPMDENGLFTVLVSWAFGVDARCLTQQHAKITRVAFCSRH